MIICITFVIAFYFAEMAFDFQQHEYHISAFIKADPNVKEYTAWFDEDSFSVIADG